MWVGSLGKPDITAGTAVRTLYRRPHPVSAPATDGHASVGTPSTPSGPSTDGPGTPYRRTRARRDPLPTTLRQQLNAAEAQPPNLASSVAAANQPSSFHEQERNRKLSGDLAISRALAESGLRAQVSECFERNSNFESYPSSAGRCQRRPARDSPTDC